MGTAWRQAEALGLLGAYPDIAFDLGERWQRERGKIFIVLHLQLGELQHLLEWYMAVPGGRQRGKYSVATS